MEKKKIYKYIWISGIFILLIIILVCIMDYKINHEYEEEGYLYFYKCDNGICTSQTISNDLEVLSKYECRYTECPQYEKTIYKEYVLLKASDNTRELYNYSNGNIISAGYDDYTFINDEYIIVKNNQKEGIINISDDVIIDTIYDKLGVIDKNSLTGYKGDYIIALKKNKYGIINYKDGSIKEEFKYNTNQLDSLLVIISNL